MYGTEIGKQIIQAMLTLLLIVAVVFTVIWGTVQFGSRTKVIEFRTGELITPELEIKIKNGTADTTYVYKFTTTK